MLVCVDACVHDAPEELIHDVGQTLSVQHPMQSAHKHGLTAAETLRGTADEITV